MINLRYYLIFLFDLLLVAACTNSKKIQYLDSNPPGLEPRIYAPGILSLSDRYEHGLAIRNNGQEHYFGIDGGEIWTYNGLVSLKRTENNKLTFDTLDFTDNIKRKNDGIIGGEPCFSLDNKVMYFVTDYPTDIWKVVINEDGKWGTPAKLDSTVNTDNSEWYPIVSYDNCLYFSSILNDTAVILRSELVNGEYKNASKFIAKFNYDCGDQVFSRNMDYIIFASPRTGGYGENDLYVAFKKKNGDWTDGFNLGPKINTQGSELAPYISPDNKYFFFTRRDQFNGATNSDIYWVNLDIISKLKSTLK